MIHFAFTAIYLLFCFLVVYGAICDMTTYVIPNRISYGLLALFVVFAGLVWLNSPSMPHIGFYIDPIFFNIAYGLVVFVFFVVFWKLRWVGGGDVKFVTAISFFMGLDDVLYFVILLSVSAVVMLAILKFILAKNPAFMAGNYPALLKKMLSKFENKAIPYGLPAAISAMIVMPDVMAKIY